MYRLAIIYNLIFVIYCKKIEKKNFWRSYKYYLNKLLNNISHTPYKPLYLKSYLKSFSK